MKTNEASQASGNWTNAPDKVYLSSCMRSDFIKAVTSGHAGDIEYIRKDVLLKWAKNEQYECFTIREDDWWQKVIDKIKSI